MSQRLSGPEHPNWVPNDELLDDIIAGRLIMGRWPKSREYTRYGAHNHNTVTSHFGTWESAVDAAEKRLRETADEWPVDVEEVLA